MTFQEVLSAFPSEGIDVTAYSPRLRKRPDNQVRQIQGLPPVIRYVPWRYVRRAAIDRTEHRIKKDVLRDPNSKFIYSFPDLSIGLLREFASSGILVVREMIGLHRGMARRIMVEEHEREGLPPFVDITEESTYRESEWLDLASLVFAPNEFVYDSLLEHGVPSHKIVATSYGWSPKRFPGATESRRVDPESGRIVFLFVGRVSFAKGAHHLLRAWHLAGCPGKLLLAGNIEGELGRRMAGELSHPSIEHLGFVKDLGPVYSRADVFVFPSLFEGGPQVTLEAAAHGLALLVSPMGTARLVNDAQAGIVIDPHDIEAWAANFESLAKMPSRVRELGHNARLRSSRFTWELASRERAVAIKRAICS